ncbi:folate-binding protein [Glaesserella sp.]|uniref:CAF17-like 4Fe-4S cluster assembly/insertion protein YgfZ n=1 Tax=Glaesserella sp. TaxID=2094731 RepID=UPI0035A0AC07
MRCGCQLVTHQIPDLCVELTQYRLIEVSGVDAEKYLQGQLTCDVSKIAAGEQTLTAHCDPKGKMSALFRLYRHAHEQFFIIIQQDLLPEALTQLKKYAVFSKVAFNPLDTPLYGTTDHTLFANFPPKVTACHISDEQPRAIFWGEIQPQFNGESTLWDLIDIQQGVPLLYKVNQFELIPQAINLQCLERAISFSKGCYIGQETVARAKFRGANKRAMFTLVGKVGAETTLPEIGKSVEMQIGENWKQTGTILSAVIYYEKLWLQVVLNKEIEQGSCFRLGNTALELCELPYELEN